MTDQDGPYEDALVRWFKTRFAEVTLKEKSTLPRDERIPWTEISPAMIMFGYSGDVLTNRLEWDRIYQHHQLSLWTKMFCDLAAKLNKASK